MRNGAWLPHSGEVSVSDEVPATLAGVKKINKRSVCVCVCGSREMIELHNGKRERIEKRERERERESSTVLLYYYCIRPLQAGFFHILDYVVIYRQVYLTSVFEGNISYGVLFFDVSYWSLFPH